MERPSGGSLLLVAPEKRLAADLWQARLLQAVGREDDIAVQEDLVKLNHEVPREFPPRVQAEADALPSAPQHADMAGREDVRALPLVTIDGADARDFDDAVQVEAVPAGLAPACTIADVSHYVRPRSALDTEALARGNSWYFPTSVEPMLPPALCDGLCSLRPDEDRLAMLAEIPFSATGQPGRPRFAAVVMRSAARLTYDQVKACLLDRDEQARAALAAGPRGQEVLDMLETAFELYRCLREARQRRGSLDFDLPEPEYGFDDKGRLLRVSRRAPRRPPPHRRIHDRGQRGRGPSSGRPESRRQPGGAPEGAFPLSCASPARSRAAGEPVRLPGSHRPRTGAREARPRPCRASCRTCRVRTGSSWWGACACGPCPRPATSRRTKGTLVWRPVPTVISLRPSVGMPTCWCTGRSKASLGLYGGALPAGQKLLRVADQLNRRERDALDCEREMARRLACMAL